MLTINTLSITPPVFNSSCLWASSYDELEKLYDCPYTGAVTTRTATLNGFQEDPQIHTHAFFGTEESINTYGYSPHPLHCYLDWIFAILERPPSRTTLPGEFKLAESQSSESRAPKPFIISIAPGSGMELVQMLNMIQKLRNKVDCDDFATSTTTSNPGCSRIGIELNTSCPNIEGRWPAAYNPDTLALFLGMLKTFFEQDNSLTIGLKLAPLVHQGQFEDWIKVLADLAGLSSSSTTARVGDQDQDADKTRHCISFLSCTNTLGSSFMPFELESSAKVELLTGPSESSAASADGLFGGLGGRSIHMLSLGNVRTFKKLLSDHPSPALRGIQIVGIGGVTSKEARERMMRAGASAVACATALGIYGVGIFKSL